ncbi:MULTISPECIES: TIR domain-containing protein [Lactobacillaceae]|uniref:TIR domain protein n=1 Tax=Levilactobacillus brevis TaxID=1580 RepID=C0SQN3_LEVBR|nr:MULTISPECIES: toll/interleukin-1 receptor domain-containing protein [Lactobacillaceae]ARO02247.1 hypothetical protein BIZ31_14970 [Lactiplantibacillus plantarum]ARO05179.1 hypothetical protein BIZ32_14930 [Lactiplantibacillus plantarum]QCZ54434.1 hypothetical protein UCCLBBS449_pA0028 [Levilactobacillus brevis]BAH56415.1 hypothetical protein [Levilactobacillus brevis]
MRKGYCIDEKVITKNKWENDDFNLGKTWDEVNIVDQFEPIDGKIKINGTELINAWFPSQTSKNVFLSHSHGDIDCVKKFAGYLESKNMNVFVDADVWGDSADLISEINHKYNCVPGEKDTFYYSLDHVITSNVYMLLIRALNRMINHCDGFIFIQSDNSTQDGITYSPWIMEELELQNMLAHMLPEEVNKGTYLKDSASLKVSHDIRVDLRELNHIENQENFNDMITFIQRGN